jgi:hypothetical protein
MTHLNLAHLGAGIALAAGLLAGCSSAPPEDRVAVVTPAVVTVPAAPAAATRAQTTIGMLPTDTPGIMRLQSFAGDVCIQDENRGTTQLSHCVCQQTTCNCQATGSTCTP